MRFLFQKRSHLLQISSIYILHFIILDVLGNAKSFQNILMASLTSFGVKRSQYAKQLPFRSNSRCGWLSDFHLCLVKLSRKEEARLGGQWSSSPVNRVLTVLGPVYLPSALPSRFSATERKSPCPFKTTFLGPSQPHIWVLSLLSNR